MIQFVLSRLLHTLVVVLGVASLVFFLIHIIPGDPVEVMLGESAQIADRELLRHNLGLDQPIVKQWLDYLGGILRFDLGNSLHSKRANLDILLERIPATAQLGLLSLFIAIGMAIPLGVLAAQQKDHMADHGAMAVSLFGISIPNFLMGPLLIMLFSVHLGWLPVSGRDAPLAIVLPALTLGTALAAVLTRMVRASLLEVMGANYIRTAHAKGLRPKTVMWRHAIPNAFLPVLTLIGLQFGALLAGAVITEIIFSWPGIGQLTIDAIQRRDYPLVQACVLVISLTYVLVNTLTDLGYGMIDPRIRLREPT